MHKVSYHTFIRDYSANKDGNAPVMLNISIQGKRWKTPVGVYCTTNQFDKTTGLVKKSHPDHAALNLIIGKAMSKANGILVNYHLSERKITIEDFKREYLRGEKKHDFIEIFRTSLYKRKKLLHKTTFRCQLSILKKLTQISPEINVHDLGPDLFDRWKVHLTKLGNNKYTVWAFFKTIKAYVKRAMADGIIQHNPFTNYPVRPPKSTRSFLEEQEVAILYSYYKQASTHSTHRKVLSYFLFSCLTGLRISDISRITHENIINNELSFVAQKNKTDNKRITIPLAPEAMQFITTLQGNLFEPISDQKTNQALKQIAINCNIKKRLTYHVSRHTFGYLLVRRGVNPAVVKELMGHENINTTMIYVHINNQQKTEGITRLSGLMPLT